MKYLINNFRKLKFWLKDNKTLRFNINKTLWETGSPFVKLEPRPLEDIFNSNISEDSLTLKNILQRQRGMSLEIEELLTILIIVRQIKPQKILEIGTYDGNTTLNIAANTFPEAVITTIDLPPEGLENISHSGKKEPETFKKRQYLETKEESKVIQIYGDSAELDFSKLGGPFDLVFIDGDHSQFYAYSDTVKSLSVLNPGGVIIWHDYEMQSVSSVIDRASAKEEIYWIKGTRLAVGFFDNPKQSTSSFAVT